MLSSLSESFYTLDKLALRESVDGFEFGVRLSMTEG